MKTRLAWIWLALAPLCWMAQGALGWYLTGRACSTATLSFGTVRALVIVITMAALVASVGALVAATRARHAVEAPGGAPPAPSLAAERNRFMAMTGLVVGVTLTMGLVFGALPALVLHLCGEPR